MTSAIRPWLFVASVFEFTPAFAGYGKYEVLLFFLTFNLVDVVTQAFFRGIYLFSDDINKGNFDFVLTKPVNPLFYSLARLTDLLDFIFLIPLVGFLAYVIAKLGLDLTLASYLLYLAFVGVGIILALAIHILSAAATMWTMESDHIIWLYRETMTVGRFPPEVLSPALQFVFTYLMPVILIVAYPAKIILGLIGPGDIARLGAVTVIFTTVALGLWRVSLRHYASASS